MKYRNLAALGCDYGKAGIGITIEQQRVGLPLLKHSIRLAITSAMVCAADPASGNGENIRLFDFQIVKNLVQPVIVVLPRVHQHVVNLAVQFGNHRLS